MEHIYTKITAGAESPFKVVYITDVHLTYTDSGDCEELRNLSAKRALKYTHSENVLNEAERMSKEMKVPIVIAGDMIDFNTPANIERVRKFTSENDVFFIAGNHDFRPMGGIEYDTAEFRKENYDSVQALFKNEILFDSRIINGVNFVALHNAYYNVEQWQFDRLKAEAGKGLPIVLFMHVPLYHEISYEAVRSGGKRKHASLMAVPLDKMQDYPEERFIQQKADEVTFEAAEYIKNCPAIKAVFSGHLHRNIDVVHESGLHEYLTGIDTVRVIEFD